jgi:hypothetical protein
MVCPQTTHFAILLSLLGSRECVTEYSAPQWGQKKVPPPGTGPARGTSARPYTPNQYAPQRKQIPAPSNACFRDGHHIFWGRAVANLPPSYSWMEAIMAHLVDKNFVERANAMLLLGILWGGLAACVLGALSYDIAYWFQGW